MLSQSLLAVRRVLLGALLLLGAVPALAQQIVYTTAVPFLLIEPDSRASGMGNAGVALGDNATAIFWNPAGLASQRGAELSLTHANWLPALTSDLFYEYLVGKYHWEGVGTIGGHITFLNLGEQEYRDEFNADLGTFRSYELAAGLSYGLEVTERLALGTGVRFIYSNLSGGVDIGDTQTKAGVSVGVDLAALYTFSPLELGSIPVTTKLGFNLANMGPSIGYTLGEDGRDDPIPTNLRFGGALSAQLDEFNKLNFAVDFNKTLVDFDSTGSKSFAEAIFSSWKSVRVCDDPQADAGECNNFEDVGVLRQITIGTGLEYWYNDLFAFRTGFFYEDPYNGNRKFLTFGAGIRYNLIGVDFSYIYPLEENSPLSNQLRFSLLLNMLR